MSYKDKLKQIAQTAQSSDIICRIITVFALVYHISALILFYTLNIKEMFYFNIFSILFFAVCSILILPGFIIDFRVPFLLAYIEVVMHQILAEYFIGQEAAFHYFILLMGFIGFLIINQHETTAVIIGILSSVLFVIFECLFRQWVPVYSINTIILTTLRAVNISLGISVLLGVTIIFVFMSFQSKHDLEEKVTEKTQELEYQNAKITELQNQIINSLASLVENRDTDTGEHIQRTSAYVEIIARKAFENKLYPDIITKKFIKLLKRAAPMHDIGKIVVPDSILKKPGRLTKEEFEQMKRHTTEGARILTDVAGISDDKEYLQTAMDVTKGHHERWDGTGYPSNLKTEDIPVSARIMAIADVFDALVSPRCYKEPIPKEEAYKIIQEESGTHFDPALVEIFLSQKDKIEEILITYTK
ncbi:MAG: HD domain-containing protein [Treponema sp.]|nr:HD domain-containing protein [Treponema sp.]